MKFVMRDGIPEKWDEVILALPGRHILQSWEWGEAKRISGWKPDYKTWWDTGDQIAAAALILTRSISLKGIEFPLRIMYIPRGPILRDWVDHALRTKVLADLRTFGKQQNAVFIKIDPEVERGRGVPGEDGADDIPFDPGIDR